MDEFLQPNKSFLRLLEEYKKYGSLTIGCDFDGTLYDYHKKGTTYDMVVELLRELQQLSGIKIVIWTAAEDLVKVEKYLIDNNIPFNGINSGGIKLPWESKKPFFSCLLDDRAGLIQTYSELKLLVEIINKERNES